MTRRELLGAGAMTPLLFTSADRILAQTYIFMQAAERDPDRICATAAEAGFSRLELMSDFLSPTMISVLGKHRLTAPIVYVGGAMHERQAAQKTRETALATALSAKEAGTLAINTNPNPKPGKERKTDEELAVQADSLNRLGEALRKQGQRLLYHTHDPEMAEDAREWRRMLRQTDPALVGLCMDVHWIHRGGQDPLKLLQEAGTRTASLHLRNSKGGVWTEVLGPGDVNYTPIAAWLAESRLQPWLVVELASEKGTSKTSGLTENLRRSREWTVETFRKVR